MFWLFGLVAAGALVALAEGADKKKKNNTTSSTTSPSLDLSMSYGA